MSEPITNTNTFELEDLPGVEITAASTLNEQTNIMVASFEVHGGKGRVTVEYDTEDEQVVRDLDALTKVLNPALYKQAELVVRATLNSLLQGLFE